MEKRIELEKRGQTPEKIKELILDNCRSTTIVGLTDEFVNLESLSLINVGLTSLKGFPKLPKLTRLELSDNRISSGLNLLETSPQLAYLSLSNNKMTELEVLQPLSKLKQLKMLDLFNNDVTNKENYRDFVFELIPPLKYLDGFDKDNKEADDTDDDDVNGNEEEDESEDDEEGDSEEEDEPGLDALYKDANDDDDSDEADFEGVEDESDDEDIEEEEDETEEEATPRGKKRKLEDGGKEDSSSKKPNGPTQ